MTTLPAELETIVADVREAAARSLARTRRRRRAAIAVALVASIGAAVGIASAATGIGYVALVERLYPGTQVSDLGDRQQRLLAELPGGTGDVVVTDLGVSDADAVAPSGTSVCDWDEPARLLECSSGPGETTIPAGTHAYRIVPGESAPGGTVEPRVLYVPDLRLELIVQPRSGDGG